MWEALSFFYQFLLINLRGPEIRLFLPLLLGRADGGLLITTVGVTFGTLTGWTAGFSLARSVPDDTRTVRPSTCGWGVEVAT